MALPESAQSNAHRHWHQCQENAIAQNLSLQHINEQQKTQLLDIWAMSDFIASNCSIHPQLLIKLLQSNDLDCHLSKKDYSRRLQTALHDTNDETALRDALRIIRRYEMTRIAWRDLSGQSDLQQTIQELSDFADVILEAVLQKCSVWLQQRWGTPTDNNNNMQQMTIIAMGKLGAHELNFSSDIDLVFVHPGEGKTKGGLKQSTSHEYFNRLGQSLISLLNETTRDGFVFRVDMRLRPFGDSGPLVVSLAAMEQYYQQNGREWERYAWIKARVCAGNRELGVKLLETLQPFIYRRYLDFGTFESLREMHALIASQVNKKGLSDNLKLGPGGIREIEFIAQSFQLLRGGQHKTLRERRLMKVLPELAKAHYLPQHSVDELMSAYTFLRNTEHRIQEYADQQTHQLPENADDLARLAYSMKFANTKLFLQQLNHHRSQVKQAFQQTASDPEDMLGTNAPDNIQDVWLNKGSFDQQINILSHAGFSEPTEVHTHLQRLHDLSTINKMTVNGRKRLDRLMPLLLSAVANTTNALETFLRVLNIINAVLKRTVYLALLTEYPAALSLLIRLCSSSPWIANHLARYPVLLDELLDPRTLFRPHTKQELSEQLQLQLDAVEGDEEAQMDILRLFKQASVLQVASADINNILEVTQVSDHLTDIAECILKAGISLAWQSMVKRYGKPAYIDTSGNLRDAGFAIVAYGKMGSFELGYGSDLDIIFLHDSCGQKQMTQSEKPLDNQVFYARLCKRIIYLLSAPTSAGRLYDIDLRLRPDGNSGFLITSIEAYEDYQHNKAWVWEHQALIKARFILGNEKLERKFNRIRNAVLGKKRDSLKLVREVIQMRERMRTELGSKNKALFDIKQDKGGIADIEFMVQYAVLYYAHGLPVLLEQKGTLAILQALYENHVFCAEWVENLSDAYRVFRRHLNRCALQEIPVTTQTGTYADEITSVIDIWQQLMLKTATNN